MTKFINKGVFISVFVILVMAAHIGCLKKDGDSKDKFKDSVSQSLNDFENRKKYSKLTKEVIMEIPDEKLEQAIIDYIIDYKIKSNFDKEYEIVTNLSKGLQYVYATWLLEAEVNNGGFNQFFFNSSGQFAQEALEGSKQFNAIEHANLISEAIEIYKKEEAMHKEVKKKGTIEAFSESYKETELNKVDDKFYSLKEDLSQLRIKYIRDHMDEFVSS